MSDPITPPVTPPVKVYEQAPGVVSSMRVTMLATLGIGAAIILAALYGWLFMSKPDAPLVLGSGVGLITLVTGAKAWQFQKES